MTHKTKRPLTVSCVTLTVACSASCGWSCCDVPFASITVRLGSRRLGRRQICHWYTSMMLESGPEAERNGSHHTLWATLPHLQQAPRCAAVDEQVSVRANLARAHGKARCPGAAHHRVLVVAFQYRCSGMLGGIFQGICQSSASLVALGRKMEKAKAMVHQLNGGGDLSDTAQATGGQCGTEQDVCAAPPSGAAPDVAAVGGQLPPPLTQDAGNLGLEVETDLRAKARHHGPGFGVRHAA